MFEETTVDMNDGTQSAADDALQAVPTDEDAGQALSDALGELMADAPDTEQADELQPDDGAEGSEKVSKGIKGRMKAYEAKGEKRGYDRGRAEAEAAWAAERKTYEERLARLQDLELQDEAKQLAADEKISEKLALRLLRAERGIAPQAAESAKVERDAQGRFMAKQAEEPAPAPPAPMQDTHVKMLLRQAERIHKSTGVDVNALFQAAPADVKQKIALGEMDFEDLAATARQRRGNSPVRTANNNTGVEGLSIRDMTDEQFERLNQAIDKGYRFDARR